MFGFFKKKEKDLVIITFKTNDMDKAQADAMKKEFQKKLPNKQVAVIIVSNEDDVKVTEVKQ